MASTLKWNIIGQMRVRSDGNQLITTVGFKVTAVDGEYSDSYQNEVELLPPPPGASVIPFEKGTEADVIGWVQAALAARHGDTHVKKLHYMLDEKIAKLKTPVELKELPWASEPPAPPVFEEQAPVQEVGE